MPGWRELNITAGTLVAFVVFVATVGATALGMQSWVDERVNSAVAPVKERSIRNRETLREVQERVSRLEWRTSNGSPQREQ